MLNQPAPFPYPGAPALLGGKRVTIVRIDFEGRRFVTGDRISRRVEVAELTPATFPDDPLQAWYDDRIVADDPEALTPFWQLHDDLRSYLTARGGTPQQMPGQLALARWLEVHNHPVRHRRRADAHHAGRCAIGAALKTEPGA